ncbi:MAG TPA: hypothetical protein VMZ53_10190 [Kofleriaceae bacterium]|nr:hypothetical protein [Kofleriaceae bacterium]
MRILSISIIAVLAACVSPAPAPGGGGDDSSGGTATTRTSDLVCARKMALDLTHNAVAPADLAKLAQHDITLAGLADQYLASPEFETVAFDWMRAEFPPTALTNAMTDVEEPARIMHHVLMADRDWHEILTATYTVDATGTEVPITDRPAAGIISTKYSLQSTVGSFRRNWAGRFERQFAGITLVAVTLPPGDMTDVTPDGLAGNPNCAGCHVHPTYGIDRLAKFAACYDDDGARKAGCEDPEASFLLQTGHGLADLGRIAAYTNEFKSQSINFFFKKLFGRDLAKEEAGFYADAARHFTTSGFKARALIKYLVTTEAYCAR